MQKNITTLEELKKEKKKLRASIEFTREALIESLDNNQEQFKRFFIENIALPASVLGLGKFAVKQIIKTDKLQVQEAKEKKFDFKPLLKKLFPIALNMLQAFLIEKHHKKMQQEQTQNATEKSIAPKLKSVS